MSTKITIRQATAKDAETIARVVAMAIGDKSTLESYCGKDYLSVLTAIAQQHDTQYSWRHSLIAHVDGAVAGAIVGYDGGKLTELRDATFAVIQKIVGRQPIISDETEAGEFYLDSVGVFPEFRGKGVGVALITALCQRAATECHSCVGLIVECGNDKAARLYTSLSFECVGTKLFFGHKMWHLQRQITQNNDND